MVIVGVAIMGWISRSGRRRPGRALIVGVGALLLIAGTVTVGYAAVTGTLYANTGRSTTFAAYANDYAVGGSPVAIAFDGTNMWTANTGTTDTVSKITAAGTIGTTRSPGPAGNPWPLAASHRIAP